MVYTTFLHSTYPFLKPEDVAVGLPFVNLSVYYKEVDLPMKSYTLYQDQLLAGFENVAVPSMKNKE